MPYTFFLSYSRGDMKDVYAVRFFEQLREEVEALRPDPLVAFVDQREIEAGTEWEANLLNALQTSATFVCLYSPRYFRSEYCGKEWKFFRRRTELHRAASAKPGEVALLPALIKPVLWIPCSQDMPDEVKAIQYAGQMTSEELTRGLRRLVMNNPDRARAVIQQIADDIVANVTEHGLLPPLVPSVPLSECQGFVRSLPQNQPVVGNTAAGLNVQVQGDGAGQIVKPTTTSSRRIDLPRPSGTAGIKEVKFVFVASPPEKFPEGFRQSVDAYRERGGSDWKPFFPGHKVPIRVLAQRIVSEDGMNLYFGELECDEHLMEGLERARAQRNLVVIIVDSWTAKLPQYKELMEALDGWRYRSCTLVVPWSESDPETMQHREELKQALRSSLYFSSRNLDIHYNDAVCSEDQLGSWLRRVITELKGRVATDAEVEIQMPVPRSVVTRPSISGPIGGGLT